MEQGSSPELIQGDQTDLSPTDSSADNVEEIQPSDAGDTYNQDFESTENPPVEDTPSHTTQTDDDTNASNTDDSVDPELEKWASSQNLKLETETERKLAKRLRDTQSKMHEEIAQNKAKFNEASQEADANNPQASDSAKIARMEFFFNNPEARELEDTMIEIALETRANGDEDGFNYYRTPRGWNALYTLAKARSVETQGTQQYEAGRKDERTNLAKKQQAGKPATNAVNSTPESAKITDADIAKMSLAEYKQFVADNPDFDPFRV